MLEIDFFSRAKLPAQGKKWNLAALATMLVYTNVRFTIKKSVAGEPTYGNGTPLFVS